MGEGLFEGSRAAFASVLASLTLFPDQTKAALSAANLREPRSRVFVVAPGSRRRANHRAPSLIEDRLPLPGRFLLSDPARLASNGAEQQIIRLMRHLQGGGESLNGIARELNRRLVPTKNAGLWQANTVGKIQQRVAARATS